VSNWKFDRLVLEINERLTANKAKLDRYYDGVPEALSAEEAVGLRAQQQMLRELLAVTEVKHEGGAPPMGVFTQTPSAKVVEL